ncbi:MAG: NAD(P)/FAD-dependent oxidoreductase [Candidatus Omnitrophica bacterium]|nr:NAD(P)/FAD-dependent oxidoreductase [Candidatus Omnitrophota bacterium]
MKKAVIIGAGPAGLAAAHKLSGYGIEAQIVEKGPVVGGLSRTVRHGDFYFDIGPHRFFTRHKPVLQWWQETLGADFIRVSRRTRIYYGNKYFNYPLSIREVLCKLGVRHWLPVFLSYLKARMAVSPSEKSFEQWVQNRFGNRLYQLFFKNYTEKIWGIPCAQIAADWAAQRIKGVSLAAALRNAIVKDNAGNVRSFIKEFHYPRMGAGMMYEAAAARLLKKGVKISFDSEVIEVIHDNTRIIKVVCRHSGSGRVSEVEGSDFCSTMPLDQLIRCLKPAPHKKIIDICNNLTYRGLLLVHLVLEKKEVFADNWIYVHSPEVRLGRIQNYKNWSPDMVPDSGKTTLSLEYFCTEGDELWSLQDHEAVALGGLELQKLGIARPQEIKSAFVMRVPHAYPVYELNYRVHLDAIKEYVGRFPNLRCIGRSGMFRYNNMDHSVLTGFLAAKNIAGASEDIWNVNTDKAYHETA